MNKVELEYFLIDYLLHECNKEIDYKDNSIDNFKIFRALVNVREPLLPSKKFLEVQKEYLSLLLKERGIIDYKKYTPINNVYLIKGDITLINTDCIVNAANKYLLGCFVPNHGCIDNAIHTYSGVELRLECQNMMNNTMEETGLARITDSYNLPSKKIIHTVGPIVYGVLTDKNKDDLRNSYINCIELAIENNMKSIAVCCISTGEFCFPNYEAALIAMDVIKNYKNIDIIINVFKEEDYIIYDKLLRN